MSRITFAHRGVPSGRGVCLVAGLAAGAVLARALSRPSRRPMPHLRTFRRALASTRGEVMAAILAAQVQARYDALCATRPHFAHPVLRWHLTYQVLPGLALYQTLQENAAQRGAAPVTALQEAGVVLAHLDVLGRWLRRMRSFPLAPTLVRLLFRPLMALFPAAGWDIRMQENSPRRIAFTVSRCFYLDVLKAYGAPELTAHYCQLDDLAYAQLPPSIRWQRSTTLARGGPSCDFCWRNVAAERPHARD